MEYEWLEVPADDIIRRCTQPAPLTVEDVLSGDRVSVRLPTCLREEVQRLVYLDLRQVTNEPGLHENTIEITEFLVDELAVPFLFEFKHKVDLLVGVFGEADLLHLADSFVEFGRAPDV